MVHIYIQVHSHFLRYGSLEVIYRPAFPNATQWSVYVLFSRASQAHLS